MKAHKEVPHLTIIEDDAKLVVKKALDRMMKAWYDVEKQREEIVKKLTEVKDALE